MGLVFFLTVQIWFGLFCLRCPETGFGLSLPTVPPPQVKRQTVSKNTSTVAPKDASELILLKMQTSGSKRINSVMILSTTVTLLTNSETGRIRFRRVRFQTPNSVSFSGLTEFRGANSVSSSQPIICVPKRTHRVFRRTHRVCRRTQ